MSRAKSVLPGPAYWILWLFWPCPEVVTISYKDCKPNCMLIWWPELALLGCCLVSLQFQCDIVSTRPVHCRWDIPGLATECPKEYEEKLSESHVEPSLEMNSAFAYFLSITYKSTNRRKTSIQLAGWSGAIVGWLLACTFFVPALFGYQILQLSHPCCRLKWFGDWTGYYRYRTRNFYAPARVNCKNSSKIIQRWDLIFVRDWVKFHPALA